MWTLVVLFSVLISHRDAYGYTMYDRTTTYTPEVTTGTGSPCGGYLYSSSGTFSSPNFPNDYPNNTRCTWYIRPGGSVVQLQLFSVNLEESHNCGFDSIDVFDGSSTSSRLLQRVCSNDTSTFTFYSTGAYLTVRFRTDSIISSSGFRASYRRVAQGLCRYNCGYQVGTCSCSSSCEYRGNCCSDYRDYCQTNTTMEPGTTWEPVATTSEPSCRYSCGNHLGGCSCDYSCQYYGNCCHDYYYYCGATTSYPFETTPYTDGPPCGGYLYSSSDTFYSPNYPNNYPNNADCIWYIRPGRSVVELSFLAVSTEGCLDAIYVYDGSSTGSRFLGKVCNNNNATFYSTGPYLTVRFRSDSSITYSGFRAFYHFAARGSCRYNCGYQVGTCSCSSSCEYRGNCCSDYTNYCQTNTTMEPWTTWGPETTTSEPSCRYSCGSHLGSCSCDYSCPYYGNCCHDYYYYCGATTYYPFETTPYTDAPTGTGAPCGGYLYSSNGTVYSPNYPYNYPNYADCIWYIRPGRSVVELRFLAVSTEGCFDPIYVYDGSSTGSRLLGSVCNNNVAIFHSTGPYLTVRFTSDGSVTRPGFRASYQVVARGSCRYNCGYQVGTCSCSSSCEYRGNCCSDYTNYCTSDYTTSWPATAQPSCRYNCGNHMGSCSCSHSCQYYGNCCNDFYSYCPYNTTSWPTTAQPSCRYNCGWHMGSCSCSYSCRYSGNCCYDFYTYCPSYTTNFWPTTAQPSCRYNCGRHMGSCSCSYSCQYHGNCCNDFYSYCPFTTPSWHTTAPPCGGYLVGSGTFASPNHPNHYQDNLYCTWQLKAQNNERVYLEFTYLQLENCCRCDYIKVYDGPSIGSRYLGTVCNTSLSSFHSSSNYLSVLFRTDGSVVGRGFRADFISSLPSSSGRVSCSEYMRIVIERSYLNSLGYDGYSLYLNDPYCRPRVTSYQVIFEFPLRACGNIEKFVNGKFVYANTIRAYSSSDGHTTSWEGEITRQAHFRLNVACRMDEDSESQIMYLAKENGNSTIIGTGKFNTSMAFYTSSSFYYEVTQTPYQVGLNQNLYVQVRLNGDSSNMDLFLDTCVAAPSPYDFQTRAYYLVRNGCGVDSTYSEYYTGSNPYVRFRFKAFQFLRAADSVYIQCKVLVCRDYDYNSRCRNPPSCRKRVARDLGSQHESETVVLGPIQLKAEPEKKEEGTDEQAKA